MSNQTSKPMAIKRVLILGGYGNFGKRIVESLSSTKNISIIIAGRSASKSRQLRDKLIAKKVNSTLETAVIDIYSSDFADTIKSLSPDLVIHTGGPFQKQDYRAPEACIDACSHYIDLADDRRFVCDITALNARARHNNVLVISGASSVPALSSTVIDHFSKQFLTLDSIDFAIAPGNQAERGKATVRGILSYTGHPFLVYRDNRWVNQYGWMSPRKLYFDSTIGWRCLANVDIPDLELFPQRYPSVNTVNFQAGLEIPLLHYSMVFMALITKIGFVKDWSLFTKLIFKMSEIFKGMGTDIGGMQINLKGRDINHQTKHIKWILCAKEGVGPYIPTLSAIILAKKLISGSLQSTGAKPCLGMYTLEDFDKEASSLGIFHHTEG